MQFHVNFLGVSIWTYTHVAQIDGYLETHMHAQKQTRNTHTHTHTMYTYCARTLKHQYHTSSVSGRLPNAQLTDTNAARPCVPKTFDQQQQQQNNNKNNKNNKNNTNNKNNKNKNNNNKYKSIASPRLPPMLQLFFSSYSAGCSISCRHA